MPNKRASPFILTLPKPGESMKRGEDGSDTIETLEFDISDSKVNKLKELLKSYGLSTNGRKDDLKSCLETFASDRDAWKAIYTPVKSRVRGGGNNGSKMQSSTMKRIVELFGERGVKKEFQTRKGSSQRTVSVTSMTDGKLQHNDKWAEDVLTSFAFSAPMVSRNRGTVEPQETPTCSTSVPSTDRNIQVDLVSGSRMDSHFQDLTIKMAQMDRNVQSLMSRIGNPSYPQVIPAFGMLPPQTVPMPPFLQSTPTARGAHSIPTATSLFTHTAIERGGLPPTASFTRECGLFSLQPNPSASIPPHARESVPPTTSNETHLIIDIDGEEVMVDRRQIPADPPAIHLSADIDTLLWEWNNSRRLIIGGRAIPIKCWDQVYKVKAGAGSGIWDMIRNEWGSWRFIAKEREHLGSDTAFWQKFTDSKGNKFTYQKILDALQDERKDRDQQDCDEAKRLFGKDFERPEAGNHFKYRKTNRGIVVFQAVDKIAKKWRELKANDPDLVARMEAILAAEREAQGC